MAVKEKAVPNIDEEALYQGIEYIQKGLATIIERKNPGYLNAFPNRQFNENGFILTSEPFLELMEDFEADIKGAKLPSYFELRIKYSPIAQFKRWIFKISNRKFLMVSERKKEMDKEFFFMLVDEKLVMYPVTTNIAHEKFLVSLFEREKIPESNSVFNTSFADDHKLVLYKDYRTEKTSIIKIPENLTPGRMYNMRLAYIKSPKGIKYRLIVNQTTKLTHSVRFLGGEDEEETLSTGKTKKSTESSKTLKSIDEYSDEVTKILVEVNKAEKETNKFGNISLGRINKIPVLVNLPAKFKNMMVKITFNKKKELIVATDTGEVIKTFTISKSPKSNWLEAKA